MIPDQAFGFTDKHDRDIYLYSGDVTGSGADTLITKVTNNPRRRSSCALMLTTPGGDPNAAYRISRALKRVYGGYVVYVFGYCKSAGTLIAIGATDVVMSEFGELGPLDIQMPKADELNNESGLVYSQALAAIKAHTFDFFETCLLDIKTKSGGTITTKTASSIATEMAVGIFSPLAGQIDPLKVGEATRAMSISLSYGSRLTTNLHALEKLTHEYATHGFVIDFTEASELLGNVREPSVEEDEAFGWLKPNLRYPLSQLQVVTFDEILHNIVSEANQGETDDTEQRQASSGGHPGSNTESPGDRPRGKATTNAHPEVDRTASAANIFTPGESDGFFEVVAPSKERKEKGKAR